MHLLDLAQENDTLLCIGGTVYDPASEDAQMLSLQVQGMFGAFDNRLRARRMMEARVANASRGRAVSPPPTGYVRSTRGQWIKEPDRAVQEAIERIFELYPRLGSLSKVVRDFRDHDRLVPRRVKGRLIWAPCDATLIHSILRNPAYAGDYVFRRRVSKKRAGKVETRLRAPSEWIVFRDHHDAYVPRELWTHIQALLASRRPGWAPLLGKGHALLQGIVRCQVSGCDRLIEDPLLGAQWSGAYRLLYLHPARRVGRQNPSRHGPCPLPRPHGVTPAPTPDHHRPSRRRIDCRDQRVFERAGAARAYRRRLDDAAEDVARFKKLLVNLPADFHHARIDLMRDYDAALARHSDLERQHKAAPATAGSLTTDDVDELVRRTANVREALERTEPDA